MKGGLNDYPKRRLLIPERLLLLTKQAFTEQPYEGPSKHSPNSRTRDRASIHRTTIRGTEQAFTEQPYEGPSKHSGWPVWSKPMPRGITYQWSSQWNLSGQNRNHTRLYSIGYRSWYRA